MTQQPAAFACPDCLGRIADTESTLLVPQDSSLLCPHCGKSWPVRNGIPRFVPPNGYADSFGFQWNAHRKTQLDSYSGLPISRKRFFQVTGWPEQMNGETILEAGSGAGRFTEVLAGTGATVFSCDYSNAIDANSSNNGGKPNLRLFQADICRLPFPRASFDKVMCLGVLQHTPDPAATFKSLVERVKPGGQIVIDVYAKSWSALLQWKYVLRPVAKRLGNDRLYSIVSSAVPVFLPLAVSLRRLAGRAGARLVPIVEYSHLGLPEKLNREWAILDTFDMYSPAHDHPQSIDTVKRWFSEAGLSDVDVTFGPNGVVGRGRRP